MVYLLALIPHRDIFPLLRAYRRGLFAGGFEGAYSLPAAAPLALISRPLPGTALKSLAAALRGEILSGGSDGKIRTGPALAQELPGEAGRIGAFWGIALDIRLPDTAETARAEKSGALYRFQKTALCAALMPEAGAALSPPAPPVFSFRAAALANVDFRLRTLSAGGYAAEWEIGPLAWLPNCKRRNEK
jgi:hypothetical protein